MMRAIKDKALERVLGGYRHADSKINAELIRHCFMNYIKWGRIDDNSSWGRRKSLSVSKKPVLPPSCRERILPSRHLAQDEADLFQTNAMVAVDVGGEVRGYLPRLAAHHLQGRDGVGQADLPVPVAVAG